MSPLDAPELSRLRQLAAGIGVALGDTTLARFAAYFDLLRLWNRTTALVANDSPLDLVERHTFDCLHLVDLIPSGACVVDLGSGAGFPAIPIAIVRPDCRVIMVESRRKKANFLREVARRLPLPNCQTIEGRAEVDVEPEKADVVTARALTATPGLLELARPLLRPGGIVLAMKGPNEPTETTDHGQHGFELLERRTYRLPQDRDRLLLVLRRVES